LNVQRSTVKEVLLEKVTRYFLSLLFAFVFLGSPASAQQVALTILHTNDTHGHLLPFSYPGVVQEGSAIADLKIRTNIGGIARRATLVKRLRKELESSGTTVWLVDAGDFSDGTPFSTEYHGEADMSAMNAVGYTFGTLGNHEFNQPLASLKNLMNLFRFPILCANAIDNAANKPLVPPSVIRQVGPVKVGVFGLVTRESSTYPAARDSVTIGQEIDTSKQMVKALRPEAGIVVLISHAGESTDNRIAATVPGIDVIVGGHSHSRLPIGEFTWRSDELKRDDVNGTVIVQAHQWGGELGRLDLLLTQDSAGSWQVTRYHARLIPVTEEIPEDAEVASIVQRYWSPIRARYEEVVGQAAGDFTARGDDLAEYNLVADSVRETYGAEFELEQLGGVRAPVLRGAITRGALVDVDPFNNTVVTFQLSGAKLKEILLKNRPAVSGIRYRIENDKLVEATIGGKPIKDGRQYRGATNSYFSGYALKGVAIKDSGRQRLDVVTDYIRKKGTVKPFYDGRRVIL
jgi:2',3'-cyclic-nucleotide 2'-phosphodiesterase (5'-nucleotidase family)